MAQEKITHSKRRNDGSLPLGVTATAKLDKKAGKWNREVIRNDLTDYEYLEGLIKLREHMDTVIEEHKKGLGI